MLVKVDGPMLKPTIVYPTSQTTDLDEFQLEALRAFLASLVSPSQLRPAFLSEGLELFRTGKRQAGTKVSRFCAHALMSLEVVIHPRGLPLENGTALPVQQTKTLKLGNDLATVVSLSVQDHTDMVASENLQQAGVSEKIHGTEEGEDVVVKDSLMEKLQWGRRESP